MIMILSTANKNKLLKSLLDRLSRLDLFPVIGVEIEFYLTSILDNPQDYFKNLGLDIECEKGKNQFEIKINYTKDIFACITKIERIKQLLSPKVTFKAKPFIGEPGSAFHVHLHLENKRGENLFIKNGEEESSLLLHSIGGLCAAMDETMLLFAPYEEAYLRYKGDSIEEPCKICWGGNNRSAAIRLPLAEKDSRRLEHRVACADSCPIEVIAAILYGVLKGIEEEINPPEKIFGNAFLEQYAFPLLPDNLEVAKELFYAGKLMKLMVS
jgi:glutamine synthetase